MHELSSTFHMHMYPLHSRSTTLDGVAYFEQNALRGTQPIDAEDAMARKMHNQCTSNLKRPMAGNTKSHHPSTCQTAAAATHKSRRFSHETEAFSTRHPCPILPSFSDRRSIEVLFQMTTKYGWLPYEVSGWGEGSSRPRLRRILPVGRLARPAQVRF